jgi:hypothetical protein
MSLRVAGARVLPSRCSEAPTSNPLVSHHLHVAVLNEDARPISQNERRIRTAEGEVRVRGGVSIGCLLCSSPRVALRPSR